MIGRGVENLRAALEDYGSVVRGSDARGYEAQCPAHEDRTPSLSFSQGERGAIFKCFAGCPQEAVLSALGLTWPDVFDEEEPPDVRRSGRRRPPAPRRALVPRDPSLPTSLATSQSQSTSGGHFSVNTGDRGDGPAPVLEMVEAWRRGEEEPDFAVDLDLSRLPRQAAALRSAAEAVAVAMGFQLTLGDPRPLPISGSFVARLLGLSPERDARRGRRLLDALVRHGVLDAAGEMPSRGRSPTRLYEPGGTTLAAVFCGPGSPGCARCGTEILDEDWAANWRLCEPCLDEWNVSQECPDGSPHEPIFELIGAEYEVVGCRRCGIVRAGLREEAHRVVVR